MKTYRQIDSFDGLFETFKFDERRFDTVGQNGAHGEIFVKESLAGVAIALEDQKITIALHFTSDGPDGLQVEQFTRWANFSFLLLGVGVGLGRAQSSARPTVVDPRYELQLDLILGLVNVIDLADIALKDAVLHTDPRLWFDDALLFDDAQHLRHFFDGRRFPCADC